MHTLTLVFLNGAVQTMSGEREALESLFAFHANNSTCRYALLVDQTGEYIGNEYAALAA
jgi:hypothetical protein